MLTTEETGVAWKTSVLDFQLYCKSKTILKQKTYFKNILHNMLDIYKQ